MTALCERVISNPNSLFVLTILANEANTECDGLVFFFKYFLVDLLLCFGSLTYCVGQPSAVRQMPSHVAVESGVAVLCLQTGSPNCQWCGLQWCSVDLINPYRLFSLLISGRRYCSFS
ncbi:hypothetical protein AMECASPLE_034422 [Ameca splendens]|uniref:Uncharacterized protein n=1 Tax=Ameca splendens TaxID=208324 RepID=A0ABV0XK65_9TELE